MMQGGTCLAIVRCGVSSLYEIPISSLTAGHQDHSAYSVTIPEKAKLWHWRMGHLEVTMFKRMIHVLTCHEVCLSDAIKLGVCEACAQGNSSSSLCIGSCHKSSLHHSTGSQGTYAVSSLLNPGLSGTSSFLSMLLGSILRLSIKYSKYPSILDKL
jgi:hypothetical protein